MDKVDIKKSPWVILIIMTMLDIYYAYLLLFDKLSVFIHPKMLIFIIFTFIVLIGLTIFQARKLFIKTSTCNNFRISYFLLLLPVLIGFIINPDSFSVDMIKNKTFTIDKTMFNEPVDSDFFESK